MKRFESDLQALEQEITGCSRTLWETDGVEIVITVVLGMLAPLHWLWVKLQRRRSLRSDTAPVRATFKPTYWDSPQGVLALLPPERLDLLGDADAFDAPRSWLADGTFLTDTAFLLEIENTSTDDFPRTVMITEVIARIERTPGPVGPAAPQRVLSRWSPAAVGPLYEIDDPEQPRVLPRVIHFRSIPERPVMLLQAMNDPLPPPGGYRLRAGSRFVFVFRFEFDVAGEYEVHIELSISESGKARQAEVIAGLRLLHVPNLDDLPREAQHLEGTGPAFSAPIADLTAALTKGREQVRQAISPAAPTDSNPVVAVVPYRPPALYFPGLR